VREKEATIAELESELATHQTEIADVEAELKALHDTYSSKIADLQAELETYQVEIASHGTELETYQAEIADLEDEIATLEAELATYQTETGTTEEGTPPPEPAFLQEEDLRYRGYEGRLISVRVVMVDATWDENTVTISWELTNTSSRRIHLDLLSVKAHDQMGIWGESDDPVEPLVIYPDLQDIEMPWPGETVQFNTEWLFGPRSDEITVEFVVVRSQEDTLNYASDDVLPNFYVTRPSD